MKRGSSVDGRQAVGRRLRPLVRGDYVLATKYADGDPCDHYFVGFFREMLGDRYLVEDGKGALARSGGFRRCERISGRVGNAIVEAMPLLSDIPGKSVWYWRKRVGELERLVSANPTGLSRPATGGE